MVKKNHFPSSKIVLPASLSTRTDCLGIIPDKSLTSGGAAENTSHTDWGKIKLHDRYAIFLDASIAME